MQQPRSGASTTSRYAPQGMSLSDVSGLADGSRVRVRFPELEVLWNAEHNKCKLKLDREKHKDIIDGVLGLEAKARGHMHEQKIYKGTTLEALVHKMQSAIVDKEPVS